MLPQSNSHSDSRFVIVVINHAKFHHRHDPIYKSGSGESRLDPGEQSHGIRPFQNYPHQHLVGVAFDLFSRRLQPDRRAMTGAVGCRESGYQIALIAEVVEQFFAKVTSSDQRQANRFDSSCCGLRNAAEPAIEDRQKYQGQ